MSCRLVVVMVAGAVLYGCGPGAAPSSRLADASTATTPAPAAAAEVATSAPPTIAVSTPTATAAATPSPTARPTPRPSASPAPTSVDLPKPSGVAFKGDLRCLDDGCTRAEITHTVTWRAPRAAGTTIRVYGVTACPSEPRDPKPGTSGPCLVPNTVLPAWTRRLLAEVPAAKGHASWTWQQDTGCLVDEGLPGMGPDGGPYYYALVVAVYSATGRSSFTIAAPGEWWQPAEGDMVC